MSEFGTYIKKIREQKNMTLNQVAMYADISAAQLSRIETGKRGTPKPQTIEKIAYALKVDYNNLMKIAGYIEDSNSTSNEFKEDDFEEWLNNPDLNVFYRELPKSEDEKIRQLREIWEIIKKQ